MSALLLALTLATPAQGGWLPDFNPQIDRTIAAQDVEIGTWLSRLRRVGLTIPIEAEGVVNGSVRVAVPVRQSGTLNAWKLDGTLTSDKLTIEGATLRDVSMQLKLRDGVLKLESLRFRPGEAAEGAAEAESPPIRASGSLPINPLGELSLTLEVDQVALAGLAPLLPPAVDCEGNPIDAAEPPLAGTVSATLSATVPARRVAQPTAWDASGPVRFRDVRYRSLPPLSGAAVVTARNGTLRVELSRATGPGVEASGLLTLGMLAPYPIDGQIEATATDDPLLAALNLRPSWLSVAGPTRLTGAITGALAAAPITFAGLAQSDGLTLGLGSARVPVAGQVRATADADAIRFSEADLRVAGGSLTGSVLVSLKDRCDLARTRDSAIDATFANIEAAAVRTALRLPENQTALAGKVNGEVNLTVPHSRWGQWTGYRGTAKLASDGIAIARGDTQTKLTDLSVAAVAADAGLTFERADATLGDGRITAAGTIPWPILSPAADAAAVASDAEIALRSIAVADLARLASLTQPEPGAAWLSDLGGELTATAAATIPAGAARQPERWDAAGSGTIDTLRWRSLELANVALEAKQSDRRLDASVRGAVFDGELSATLSRTEDGTTVEATAGDWDAARAGDFASTLPILPDGPWRALAADLSGRIGATVQGRRGNGEPWLGTVRIESDDLAAGDVLLSPLVARGVSDANRRTGTMQANALGGEVVATAAARDDAMRVNATAVGVDAAQLAAVASRSEVVGNVTARRLLERLQGAVSFEIEAGRTGDSPWQGRGRITSNGLASGEVAIGSLDVEAVASADRLWADATADAFGGRMRAAAETPRNGAAPVVGSATFDAISLTAASRLFGQTASGTVAGSARFSLAAGVEPLWDRLQVDGQASGQQVTIERDGAQLAIDDAKMTVRKSDAAAWARVSGAMLDGEATITLLQGAGPNAPLRGEVDAAGWSVSQLLAAAPQTASLAPRWAGTFDADLLFAIPQTDTGYDASRLAVQGPAKVSGLRVGGRTLTSQMAARLNVTPSSRRIEQIAGSLGGGQVSGSIVLPPAIGEAADEAAAEWSLGVTRMQVGRVEAFLGQPLPLDGAFDVRIQGQTSSTGASAAGRVSMADGRIKAAGATLRLTGLRFPFALSYDTAADRLQARIRSLRVGLGRGSTAGDAKLTVRGLRTVDPKLAFDSDLTLKRLDLRSLAGAGTGRGLSGSVSGTIRVKATRLRSASDLSGSIRLSLADPSATGTGVGNRISPYLGGSLADFQTGRLEATLGGGTLAIRELSLQSARLDAFASGTVGLDLGSARGGRLDLDLVAATGRPEEGVARTAIVQRAITLAAPGVGLLIAANESLRDRVVHLRIGGTTKAPVVSVKPLETAREASLRFLVRSAVGG